MSFSNVNIALGSSEISSRLFFDWLIYKTMTKYFRPLPFFHRVHLLPRDLQARLRWSSSYSRPTCSTRFSLVRTSPIVGKRDDRFLLPTIICGFRELEWREKKLIFFSTKYLHFHISSIVSARKPNKYSQRIYFHRSLYLIESFQ